MSEVVYALRQLKDLREKKHLKVMSVGCGPSTELFALDYLKNMGEYKFNSAEFRGIDPAKEVWMHIHKKIKVYEKDIYTVKYYYADIVELIDTIVKVKWVPDLIVFQYVFSDMEKHCPQDKLNEFISKIAIFINSDMEEDTYIVLNDINLTTRMGGGREHFDNLLAEITEPDFRKYHFKNNNKRNHFEYGDEYDCNDLVMDFPSKLQFYEPYDSCASAQLIIKKVIR
jgi:hypothetical protein